MYAERIHVFIKILSSSLNTVLNVDTHCSDICCDEFPQPQIDYKSKQVKEQCHEKNYLQSVWRKLAVLNTENIQICGWITKLDGIKMQYVCIFSISAEYLQKIWICNFPRYCSDMPNLRWIMLQSFVANLMHFPAGQKFWKSVKMWQSHTQFNGGNFF